MPRWLKVFSLSLLFIAGCATKHSDESMIDRLTMVMTGDVSLVKKQYAWHPTIFAVHTQNKLDDEELKTQLRNAVDAELASKGYQRVEYGQQVHMTVGFGMALASEMSDEEILQKVGLVPGLTGEIESKDVEKGSVLIAFYHDNESPPFWRVMAQGFAHLNFTQAQRVESFNALAQKMLSSVPAME